MRVPEVWVDCGNCGDGATFAPDTEPLPDCEHCGYDDSWQIDCAACGEDLALDQWLVRYRVTASVRSGDPRDTASAVTCTGCAIRAAAQERA